MSDRKYYLKDISQPTADTVVLELADIKGVPVFNYRPGQYVMISYVNDRGVKEERHAFSIASSPSEADYLKLGIKVGGRFTKGLLSLKPGDRVSVAGPFGKFVFNPEKHKNLVMIAGGIGITPFLSALRYATDHQLANKLSLIYSNRTLRGSIFLKEIKELEKRNPNIRTLISITEETIPTTNGFINERLNSQNLSDFIGGVAGKTIFLCGPMSFMEAIKANLIGLGAHKSQIEMEAFSMLSDKGFKAQFKNLSYAITFAVALVVLSYYSITNASIIAAKQKAARAAITTGVIGVNADDDDDAAEYAQAPSPVTSVSGAPVENGAVAAEGSQPVGQIGGNVVSAAKNSPAPSPVTSTSIVETPAKKAAPTVAGNKIAAKSTAPAQTAPKATSTAPKPTTSASIPAETAPVNNQTPQVNQPATNQNNQTLTPAPVTSVSAPAQAPIQNSPTVNQPAPSQTPAPVTSVSAPAPIQNSPTINQPAPNQTPTPTTAVSAPAPANNNPVVTNPTPTQPTPTQNNRNHDDDDD